jgi:hypothetical protein
VLLLVLATQVLLTRYDDRYWIVLQGCPSQYCQLGRLQTAHGEHVPGPRSFDLAQDINFPWKGVISADVHVTSLDAYGESLQLCRQGLLCGPSSGLALRGLYQYLEKAKNCKGEPDRLRGPDGFVTCKGRASCFFVCSIVNSRVGVFIYCDYPFQYIGDYFKKLDPSNFPKINREELFGVDLYPYGLEGKLSPSNAQSLLQRNNSTVATAANKSIAIPDLRDPVDFVHSEKLGHHHHDCALNLDLQASKEPNPFLDSATLVRRWMVLSGLLLARQRDVWGSVPGGQYACIFVRWVLCERCV